MGYIPIPDLATHSLVDQPLDTSLSLSLFTTCFDLFRLEQAHILEYPHR